MKKITADRVKLALTLFLSYFKIGLFTFGGGYAMIALIEREFVVRKKWINEVELYEIIAIAESTPGPIAINCATFVGYKVMGFVGSFLSTLAVCIPSFAIIYLISVFYDAFMALTAVAYAFEGIKVGISIMITVAGVNMIRKGKKNAFGIGVFLVTFGAATCIDIFSLDFSTIYLILIGAALGITMQIVRDVVAKKKGKSAADVKASTDGADKSGEGVASSDVETGLASKIVCRDGNYSYGIGEELKRAVSDKEGQRGGTADENADLTNTGREKREDEAEGKLTGATSAATADEADGKGKEGSGE